MCPILWICIKIGLYTTFPNLFYF
eukprot:UN07371